MVRAGLKIGAAFAQRPKMTLGDEGGRLRRSEGQARAGKFTRYRSAGLSCFGMVQIGSDWCAVDVSLLKLALLKLLGF